MKYEYVYMHCVFQKTSIRGGGCDCECMDPVAIDSA